MSTLGTSPRGPGFVCLSVYLVHQGLGQVCQTSWSIRMLAAEITAVTAVGAVPLHLLVVGSRPEEEELLCVSQTGQGYALQNVLSWLAGRWWQCH